MKKSQISKMPEFFDRYINRVEDLHILDALSAHADLEKIIGKKNIDLLDGKIYAPGKWTIKDIIQHLIDVERIMSYRALCFARADTTLLPGFDEDSYGKTAQAESRPIQDLLAEFSLTRKSTLALFESFTHEMLMREGICFSKTISVLALGFVLVGHPLHHHYIIQERYLPLLV